MSIIKIFQGFQILFFYNQGFGWCIDFPLCNCFTNNVKWHFEFSWKLFIKKHFVSCFTKFSYRRANQLLYSDQLLSWSMQCNLKQLTYKLNSAKGRIRLIWVKLNLTKEVPFLVIVVTSIYNSLQCIWSRMSSLNKYFPCSASLQTCINTN